MIESCREVWSVGKILFACSMISSKFVVLSIISVNSGDNPYVCSVSRLGMGVTHTCTVASCAIFYLAHTFHHWRYGTRMYIHSDPSQRRQKQVADNIITVALHSAHIGPKDGLECVGPD